MRNPEVFELNEGDAVKGHIDIYNFQLENLERDEEDKQSENILDLKSSTLSKKKSTDWRDTLEKLKEVDLKYVDMARALAPDVSEDEAQFEEKIFLESEKLKSKRKVKENLAGKCFISFEAKEDRDEDSDEDRDEYICNVNLIPSTVEKYFSVDLPTPVPSVEGGVVPGFEKCKVGAHKINGKIAEMENEKNVRELLQECLDWTKIVDAETLDFANKEKKFCEHESSRDYIKRKEIFSKSNPNAQSSALRQFATYILQPKFKNSVFLGMYSSGFDNHFVFAELVKMGVKVEPVYRGNKLITFKIPALNIKFLDFFCFVPSSLKNLEKSFNLNTGSKGYFPHLLNHPRHYGLKIPHLPPKHFYEPELMKGSELEMFDKWYNENYESDFNFSQEILTYCELDVKILLAAILTFIKETLIQQSEFKGRLKNLLPNGQEFKFKVSDASDEFTRLDPNLVHPFSRDVCTLSSYANVLFRSFYLPEDYLPIITHDIEESYACRSSKEEIEYLTYLKDCVGQFPDLQFGTEFRSQRRFTVVCPDTEKCHTFYVDGFSPSKQVK